MNVGVIALVGGVGFGVYSYFLGAKALKAAGVRVDMTTAAGKAVLLSPFLWGGIGVAGYFFLRKTRL
jgi:hypothetical protein